MPARRGPFSWALGSTPPRAKRSGRRWVVVAPPLPPSFLCLSQESSRAASAARGIFPAKPDVHVAGTAFPAVPTHGCWISVTSTEMRVGGLAPCPAASESMNNSGPTMPPSFLCLSQESSRVASAGRGTFPTRPDVHVAGTAFPAVPTHGWWISVTGTEMRVGWAGLVPSRQMRVGAVGLVPNRRMRVEGVGFEPMGHIRIGGDGVVEQRIFLFASPAPIFFGKISTPLSAP
ncbi:hypothetical protein M2267_001471 [Ensifer sp. KUDG1]